MLSNLFKNSNEDLAKTEIEINSETKVSELIELFKKYFQLTLRLYYNVKPLTGSEKISSYLDEEQEFGKVVVKSDMKAGEVEEVFSKLNIKAQVADKTDMYMIQKTITLKEARK